MKKKKIIAKIQEKIAYYDLVVIGYQNDGDIECVNSTKQIIAGLKESIEIIQNVTKNDINKSILKQAGKIICVDNDQTLLEAVNLVISTFNVFGDEKLDWVDGVQVVEKYEYVFTIVSFLELIGVKVNENGTYDLLK